MLELAAVALAAFVIARHLRIRAIWIIIAAFVNASAPQEEYDATVAARDELNRRRLVAHSANASIVFGHTQPQDISTS